RAPRGRATGGRALRARAPRTPRARSHPWAPVRPATCVARGPARPRAFARHPPSPMAAEIRSAAEDARANVWRWGEPPRAVQDQGELVSVVPMLVNSELSDVPRKRMPLIAATATRAVIRPYSTAVAPDSSLSSSRSMFRLPSEFPAKGRENLTE